MRKLVLTLAALAAVGIALPVATQPASAGTVVIKKDRGHHYGWRNHRAQKVVIVKKRHHRNHGAAVIVR
jgi:Spy/CpxP family protein refolding chaperone